MRIFATCANGAGLDVLQIVCRNVKIDGIIGLSPRAASDALSGYVDASVFARERAIPFHTMETYSLTSDSDKQSLLALEIDVLIVVGWQRLIPQYLIDALKVGAIGAHGSADGIAGGRGRSPQNWAIMLGSERFSISLFLVTPGIDDGPILATKTFPITTTDDISDTYRKVSMLVAQMICDVLESDPKLNRRIAQSGEAYYFPQRLPEDGAIDWDRPAKDVAAFIRALARPYPGAFSVVKGSKIKFWRCNVFEMKDSASTPGLIKAAFVDGSLLIACRDSDVVVYDWEAQDNVVLREGDMLPSENFRSQIATIIARHEAKFPQYPLSPLLLDAAR